MSRRFAFAVLVLSLTCSVSAQSLWSQKEFSNLVSKAKEGNTEVQVKLGMAFQYGSGVAADAQSAEYWLKSAAGFGEPQAMVQLGLLYMQPQWRGTHAEKAMQWFLRAAANGYAPAEHNLGMLHLHGIGTPQNDEQAIRWFRKAAQHGSLESTVFLGLLLLKSAESASRNEGFKLVREAAKKGDPKGMNALAYCHDAGLGTERNVEEAARWYKRAAEEGDLDAMRNLSSLYQTGPAANLKESIRWSQKACDSGDPLSCKFLAQAYMSGAGVRQDHAQAYKLALMAGLQQSEIAKIEESLPEVARDQAAADAERWKIDHARQLSTRPR